MIGVFDSGYGGLSVFKELEKNFPHYDFLYLGDNARAPYGIRSQEVIYQYTKNAVEWLFREGAELVIIACNSASAQALPRLIKEWLPDNFPDRKIIGVIDPVVEKIAEGGKGGTIGVIATKSTVNSHSYIKAIYEKVPDAAVIQKACPILVPLVEEGRIDDDITKLAVQDYVREMQGKVSSLILGCTHYYFLRKLIEKEFPHALILDASSVMPAYLLSYLRDNPGLETKIGRNGLRRFVTTDEKDSFADFVLRNLQIKIMPERIELS